MIHFDTSFRVDVLRERRRGVSGPARQLLDRLPDDEEGCLSVYALCELLVGVALAPDPTRERERVQRLITAMSVVLPDEEQSPTRTPVFSPTFSAVASQWGRWTC